MRTIVGVLIVLAFVVAPYEAAACDPPPPLDSVHATLANLTRDTCIEFEGFIPHINPPDCLP